MKRVRSNKGFTLVELIIVIAILAIIMLIAIPNFSGIQQRMKVRADKATAAQIGKAVRVWYTEYGSDPAFQTTVDGAVTTGADITVENGLPTPPTDGTALAGTQLDPKAMPQGTSMVMIHQIPQLVNYVDTRLLPTSRIDATTKVTSLNQYYWVGLTGSGTSEKVAVGIGEATVSLTFDDPDVAGTDLLPLTQKAVTYDGTADGVAYLEP